MIFQTEKAKEYTCCKLVPCIDADENLAAVFTRGLLHVHVQGGGTCREELLRRSTEPALPRACPCRTPSAHSRAAATRAPPACIPGAGKGLCKHSSPSLPAPAQGTAMPTPNKTGVPPAPGSWPPALPRVGFPRGRGWHLSLQPGALLSLCLGLAPWCHSREAAEQPQKVLSRHVCPGTALNQGLQV